MHDDRDTTSRTDGNFAEWSPSGEEKQVFILLSRDNFQRDSFGYETFPASMEGRMRPVKVVHALFPVDEDIAAVVTGPRTAERFIDAGITTVPALLNGDFEQVQRLINNIQTSSRIMSRVRERFLSLERLPHYRFLRDVFGGSLHLTPLPGRFEDNLIRTTNELVNAAQLTFRERVILNAVYNLAMEESRWQGVPVDIAGRRIGITRGAAQHIQYAALVKIHGALRRGYEEKFIPFSIV